MSAPLSLSTRADQTEQPPITYFMEQGLQNPNLISLAAGLVDPDSLPIGEVSAACAEVLADPRTARSALQYGMTQGYRPLREKLFHRLLDMDGLTGREATYTADDIVLSTGSQQLLYLLGELLLDPGDIVITEAPSYFVYHGILTSLGIRTLAVGLDRDGMRTDLLEDLLKDLERSGELPRVKLIYTVDYFQNPTGLTLSLPRRHHMLELARRFSKTHRLLILEDAAYRELRFAGDDVPSIKSLDQSNEQVILAMTFSKPLAPGLKTGYGVLPRDLVGPLLRFKGNHDFGSSNFNQHVLDCLLGNGVFQRHAETLREAYRSKRDALLGALEAEFPPGQSVRWTQPDGGMCVWLTLPPGVATGQSSRFMAECLREGVIYVPGECCHVKNGDVPLNEARLCYGVATHDELREAARRLGRAARTVMGTEKIRMRAFAGCKG